MDLLEFDQKRLEDTYKFYNTNEEEVKRNVEILKEWIKKQPHLPQKLPYDGFFEQMLKNNKYRIEQTKERIDSYFTLKTLNLKLYHELANEDFRILLQTSIGIGLSPICLENNQIVMFGYLKSSNPDLFDCDQYLQLLLAVCEISLRYNNAISIRCVIDFKNLSLGQFKKVDLIKLRNTYKLMMDGFGFRIAGLDILNLPVYCNPVLVLFKSIVSAKIVDRIRVHDNLESLHKKIPKHVLPEDLGGTAKYTFKKIEDATDFILKNQSSFLADCVNYFSNEKLRIGKSKYDDMFGVDGTFKQLNID